MIFSDGHVLYKTPKFFQDAPPQHKDKTYLDFPFDIDQCASLAINNPHYHVYHYNKTYKTFKQVYLVLVDVPSGINFVNGQHVKCISNVCNCERQ